MGACEKLNTVAVGGNLLIAGFAGLIFESWLIFLIVAVYSNWSVVLTRRH